MLNRIDRLHDKFWVMLDTEQRKVFIEWFEGIIEELDSNAWISVQRLKELLKNVK